MLSALCFFQNLDGIGSLISGIGSLALFGYTIWHNKNIRKLNYYYRHLSPRVEYGTIYDEKDPLNSVICLNFINRASIKTSVQLTGIVRHKDDINMDNKTKKHKYNVNYPLTLLSSYKKYFYLTNVNEHSDYRINITLRDFIECLSNDDLDNFGYNGDINRDIKSDNNIKLWFAFNDYNFHVWKCRLVITADNRIYNIIKNHIKKY